MPLATCWIWFASSSSRGRPLRGRLASRAAASRAPTITPGPGPRSAPQVSTADAGYMVATNGRGPETSPSPTRSADITMSPIAIPRSAHRSAPDMGPRTNVSRIVHRTATPSVAHNRPGRSNGPPVRASTNIHASAPQRNTRMPAASVRRARSGSVG